LLHISKEEQRQRLLSRIDYPDKNWKFNLADTEEQKFWDDCMKVYEADLSNTSFGMWCPPTTRKALSD